MAEAVLGCGADRFFCQFSDSCAVTTKAIHLPKVTAGTGEECNNNRVPVGVWGYFLFDGLSFNYITKSALLLLPKLCAK